MRDVDIRERVHRARELVDRLHRIADMDPLRVRLLRDDRGHHRVRVLRLVKQDVVDVGARVAQLPQLQVVLVLERQRPIDLPQIRPREAEERLEIRRDRVVVRVRARPVLARNIEPFHVRDVTAGRFVVGRLAVVRHATHHEPSQERFRERPALLRVVGDHEPLDPQDLRQLP